MTVTQSLRYWLSEHPSIVNFRWSHAHSWGSTWSFLLTSIAAYVSAAVFVGLLLSAAAEIRDTRWLWRRTRTATPLQWLLCFPLGTRPSGRVFFWSHAFYLSRFLHLPRTFVAVLRRRRVSAFQVLNQSALLCMSFLWLEYSQSFQVVAILLATLLYAVVYGYRFWTAVGLPGACFPFVLNCQVALLGCNLVCHVGVLLVHLMKGGGGSGGGGCNGIGAWGFNSVMNAAILLLFLKFYLTHYNSNNKVMKVIGFQRSMPFS